MKKVVCFLVGISLCFCVYTKDFAIESVYNNDRNLDSNGWHVCVYDDDIDASAELITELNTTYAQLATFDTVEVLSSDASDGGKKVTVYGLASDDTVISNTITLHSTATNPITSDSIYMYIDQATLNAECVGTVTIRKQSGDTFITSIPAGQLSTGMAQHFTGDKTSYITNWSVGKTAANHAITYELRYYSDDADCLDAADGYIVLDRIYASSDSITVSHRFPQPIKCPAGGWIAVYGTGSSADSAGKATLQGYDR